MGISLHKWDSVLIYVVKTCSKQGLIQTLYKSYLNQDKIGTSLGYFSPNDGYFMSILGLYSSKRGRNQILCRTERGILCVSECNEESLLQEVLALTKSGLLPLTLAES